MPDQQSQIQELQRQLMKLKNDFDQLSGQFYKNNFASRQEFNKDVSFNTRLKVPSYSTLPTCEKGELAEKDGVLYIGSATDTWTIVGTQS